MPSVAVTDSDEAAAKIAGQEGIAVAVTDNVAVGEVIAAGGVAGKHGCAGLARGSAVGRPCSVDEDVVKLDANALESVENEVVDGPEGFFGKGLGAEAVLVGDHDEFKVCALPHEGELGQGAWHETELGEAVDLFVGRFGYQGAVAVDEDGFFQSVIHDL